MHITLPLCQSFISNAIYEHFFAKAIVWDWYLVGLLDPFFILVSHGVHIWSNPEMLLSKSVLHVFEVFASFDSSFVLRCMVQCTKKKSRWLLYNNWLFSIHYSVQWLMLSPIHMSIQCSIQYANFCLGSSSVMCRGSSFFHHLYSLRCPEWYSFSALICSFTSVPYVLWHW